MWKLQNKFFNFLNFKHFFLQLIILIINQLFLFINLCQKFLNNFFFTSNVNFFTYLNSFFILIIVLFFIKINSYIIF